MGGSCRDYLGLRDITSRKEVQINKEMAYEMETGIMTWFQG